MKSPLETYFTGLQGKRIIVLGLGVSNRPLVRMMLRYGCTVIGCDRTPREKLDAEVLELEAAGCELRLGDSYLDNLSGDIVFRTPGMHPESRNCRPFVPAALWSPARWRCSLPSVPVPPLPSPVPMARPLPLP